MADVRDIIEEFTPVMREMFLSLVQAIHSEAQLGIIAAAIRDGRINDAMLAVRMSPEAFGPLDDIVRAAYIAGGRDTLAALPAIKDPFRPGRLVVRFDQGNPRAESFMRTTAGNLIQELIGDQLKGIREVLETSVAEGRGSRRIALDLVGRIDRTTGRRSGGIVGLHSQQMRSVEKARRMLQDGDNAYFQLKSRDRRFDKAIRRQFEERGGVGAEKSSKYIARYSDTLLRYRGERIARTEMGRAAHAGANEGMQQVIDTGAVKPQNVRKVWHATPDGRVRESHDMLDATSIGHNEAFESPATNALLRYPGDTSLGAQAIDVINCRCWMETRVDFLANDLGS